MDYIGARYVIKIYENSQDPSSAEWEANNFEPIVLVTFNNGSYLSKKAVPASIGNPADNPSYWVQTGFYNGQIASLQSQIDTINNVIIPEIMNEISDEKFNDAPSTKLKYYGSILDKSCQGMCVDDNGFIYVASPETSPACTITKAAFNGGVTDTRTGLTLYHANDMTYLDGFIYVASCHAADGTANANKKIVKLNPDTWATTELDPFSAENPTAIFGISKFDEDHLICGLTTGQLFGDVHIYKLNIHDLSYEELPIENPNNIYLGYYYALQSMEYDQGKLYILTSAPNSLIQLDITDSSSVVSHVIGINGFFDNGILAGELEGISILGSNYGSIFLINSHSYYDNYGDIKFGLFSPFGNLPDALHSDTRFFNVGGPSDIYVNGGYTNILETGILDKPFKRLYDGILFVNTDPKLYQHSGTLRVTGGDYPTPGKICNKIINLITASASDVLNIPNNVQFDNCQIFCNGRTGDATESTKQIKFSGTVLAYGCKIIMLNTSLAVMAIYMGSDFKGINLYTNGLFNVSDSEASIHIVGTSINTRLVDSAGGSLVQALGLVTSDKITIGSSTTLLYAGNPT